MANSGPVMNCANKAFLLQAVECAVSGYGIRQPISGTGSRPWKGKKEIQYIHSHRFVRYTDTKYLSGTMVNTVFFTLPDLDH